MIHLRLDNDYYWVQCYSTMSVIVSNLSGSSSSDTNEPHDSVTNGGRNATNGSGNATIGGGNTTNGSVQNSAMALTNFLHEGRTAQILVEGKLSMPNEEETNFLFGFILIVGKALIIFVRAPPCVMVSTAT